MLVALVLSKTYTFCYVMSYHVIEGLVRHNLAFLRFNGKQQYNW
ncbi:hypothetical protein SBF1_190096 [Candidatus Desulfosporosinus infrequens]|uniref:Uncharacterized protein n=1 Tax=Candidatus Desulfosporosinus infrequens TaxID=2043169 RepID=A0A2U3KER0_9FIRM|nr:hypothetical protein SBF1_190096 [Candidatus Desulfosporosinus infrequens]